MPPHPTGVGTYTYPTQGSAAVRLVEQVAEDRTDKQIANHLRTSHRTVESHHSNAMLKLGVYDPGSTHSEPGRSAAKTQAKAKGALMHKAGYLRSRIACRCRCIAEPPGGRADLRLDAA